MTINFFSINLIVATSFVYLVLSLTLLQQEEKRQRIVDLLRTRRTVGKRTAFASLSMQSLQCQ